MNTRGVTNRVKITNEYQAAYAARALLSWGGGVEKLSAVLLDAKVDLQPHQISAAIFAVGNPYAKGVLLADEVGLGKTVEAGIILAQKWAEGKRKIIVVVTSTLKTQWADELSDKFYLPVRTMYNYQFTMNNARSVGGFKPILFIVN